MPKIAPLDEDGTHLAASKKTEPGRFSERQTGALALLAALSILAHLLTGRDEVVAGFTVDGKWVEIWKEN